MIKKNNIYRRKGYAIRIVSVLLTMMFALMLAAPDFAYAAGEKNTGEPIREVHKVGVGEGAYCFFVTDNVVLTPAQVAEMTDEELTAYILDKAGFYMKKSNCRSPKNDKIISVKNWNAMNGAFYLSEPDLESLRAAQPVDGKPVKFYMDLLVCDDVGDRKDKEADKAEEDKAGEGGEEADTAGEAADTAGETADKAEEAEEEKEEQGEQKEEDIILYSTYKRNEPELIFAVVATETDAAYGQDVCKEDAPRSNNIKMPKISESADSEDEMLPENRTINMVDRSGKPIKATLEEGDPVKLEWIEPKNNGGNEEGSSFIDRIPGGTIGLVIICAAVAAIIAAAVMAGKKKRTDW